MFSAVRARIRESSRSTRLSITNPERNELEYARAETTASASRSTVGLGQTRVTAGAGIAGADFPEARRFLSSRVALMPKKEAGRDLPLRKKNGQARVLPRHY